ncbi:MAG TPA: type II secretion system F family protein [Verrucomicrobiae bacterium]
MPLYQYHAINKSGRNTTGSLAAPDESSLDQKLRDAGLWLTEARVEANKTQAASTSTSRVRLSKLRGGKGRRELIEFCTLMNFQIRAGVTVVRALDVVAHDCKNPKFREVLLDMQKQIEGGLTIHETLALYPQIFPLHFVSVIRAGEGSSKLPEAFEDLRDYMEWIDQMLAQVRQATLYPAVVSIVILCFAVFLFTFIVPVFAKLLTSLKLDLPLITKIVFGLGDFFHNYWYVWIIVIPSVIIAVPLLKKHSPAFLLAWDRWKLHYPIFGELNLMLCLSRFTHNFSILYSSGMPIVQAFEACQSGLIANKVVENAVAAVQEEVKAGSTISEAMHRQPIFPGLLVRMISVGELSGNLDKALDNVSDYYNDVIPRRIKAVFAVAEPMLMVILIFIVGCVALAIYLPIISLMGAIK